jgi:carbonic anhydrase
MNTRLIFSTSIAALVIAMASSSVQASNSSNNSSAKPASTTSSGAAIPTDPHAHWSYSGSDGPSNWSKLSTAYDLCQNGHQQSPINISAASQAELATLNTKYQSTPLVILNNGHTVQVNYAPGSTMTVGHSTYDLLQFHFHTPSENKVNGQAFPMEVHFVHKSRDGVLGVLGVMFQAGKKNIALQEIWNHLPKSAGSAQTISSVAVNGLDLLPAHKKYYRFVGSLTTPPCSEKVQWHVLKDPVEASSEQINAFTNIIGKNARPVQPLNVRLLIDSSNSGGSNGGSTH